MALSSPQFSLFTAVHKHYSLEQWKEFASQNPDCLEVTLVLPDPFLSPVFRESFLLGFWPWPPHSRWLTSHVVSDMLIALFLSQHLAASSGTGSSDFEQLEQILNAIPQVKYVCLDVANGYSEHFVEFVKDVRKRFPEHTIMVCLLSSSGSVPLLPPLFPATLFCYNSSFLLYCIS